MKIVQHNSLNDFLNLASKKRNEQNIFIEQNCCVYYCSGCSSCGVPAVGREELVGRRNAGRRIVRQFKLGTDSDKFSPRFSAWSSCFEKEK